MNALFSNINRYLLLSTVIAASAGFLFGFDTGNIAGALIFIKSTFHTTAFQNEWIVSLTILGAFFSSIISGKFVDLYGRKTLLIVAAIFFVIGTLLASLSTTVFQLMMARFILGLAIGISSYTAPLYISEISPARLRGFFVLLNGVFITGGEAIAYRLDYYFSFTQNWRAMFFIGIIPALILGIGMSFMPRSPRWLINKSVEKAKAVLAKLHGAMQAEAEIKNLLKIPSVTGNFNSLFTNPVYRKLLWIGVALGIFQQFFGINTVMYYGPMIFQKAGFHDAPTGILLTFIMGLVNTIATIVTGLVIDQFGRRKLLMIGAGMAAISLFLISWLFYIGIHQTLQTTSLLILMITYIIGYCISVGSLFWLIISEIFPLSVRGQAMSIATAIQWFANFLVSVSFLSLLNAIGPSITFSLYGWVCCLSIIFTYFYIPETKQQSLEELETNLPYVCRNLQ